MPTSVTLKASYDQAGAVAEHGWLVLHDPIVNLKTMPI